MNRRGFLKALGIVPIAPVVLKGMEFPAYAAEEEAAPQIDPVTEAFIGVATGTILPYMGNEIPEGWLLCDGRKISVREYPELHAVLGGVDAKLPGLIAWSTPVVTGSHTHGVTATTPNYSSHNHSFSLQQEFIPYRYIIKV